jgi:ferric-dicitrate binding protein FerR (iron transport regulator)
MNVLFHCLNRRRASFVSSTVFAIALLAVTSSSTIQRVSIAGSFDERTGKIRCLSKGGTVNAAEGEVFARTGRSEWREAAPLIALRNGDGLKTGPNSRAELLLNPGSFLRLSENTEIVYIDTSVTNLKIRLVEGTAILEVAVNDTWGYLDAVYVLITVVTSKAEYAILPGGIYRFRIDESGGGEMAVRKGWAVVNGVTVREGKKAVISNGPPLVQSFNKSENDRFDQWSLDRAKMLLQANKDLKNEEWYEGVRTGKKPFYVEEQSSLNPHIKNQYIVSARAGTVNHVEGASFKQGDEEDWSTLAGGYFLREGDEVKTHEGSRAEILLSPDSYLRLSGDTHIQFSDTSFGGVSLSLMSGLAIIELSDEKKTGAAAVKVSTPHGECLVESGGAYRFEIEPAGQSRVMVRRGQMRATGFTVKEGKKIVFDGSSAKVAEFDRDAHDSFDVWSSYRSALMAAPTRSPNLPRSNFKANRYWYCGLWFYNTSMNCFTFVPGRWDFHNPYGGSYSVKYINVRRRF